MRIKKTLFTTEIEITPQEIKDIHDHIDHDYGIFAWLVSFITEL